jgi:cell division protein FtsW
MGWVFLFSASYPVSAAQWGDAFTVAGRQLRFLAGGVVLFAFGAFCPLRWFRLGSLLFHCFALLLLALTLRFGVSVGGAARWLAFGPFQVQPSEFAKVTLVLALAAVMARWWSTKGWWQKGWWWLFGVGLWLCTVVLVLLQPHLSGGIILASIGAATLLFARMPLFLWLATLIGVGIAGYSVRHAILHPYQQKRWQTAHGLHWGDERRLHYQSRQAALALGAGGWFGRGLFQGRQKFLFLPSAHNDFVFAVIGEEWGFLGSVGVLFFFTLLIYWAFRVAASCSDPFLSGIAGGLGFWLWFQALLHIAVNVGLLPPTGIPLPFVSAGGSSLGSTLLAMGLLVNVARQGEEEQGRGMSDGVGDGRGRDRGTHLSRHRPRDRRTAKNP